MVSFICFDCNSRFDVVNDLMNHYRYHHRFGPLHSLHCRQGICRRYYDSYDSLSTHLLSHVNDFELENVQNPDLPLRGVHDDPGYNFARNLEYVDNLNENVNGVREVEMVQIIDDNANAIDIGQNGDGLVNPNVITVDDFMAAVNSSALGFVSSLYAEPTLPRSHVQLLVNSTTDFLASGFLPLLHQKVCGILTEAELFNHIPEIEAMFNILENPFQGLETEYSRLKAFTANDNLISPESYIIHDGEDGIVNIGGHAELRNVAACGEFMPMRRVLKSFLELKGCFNGIMNYITTVQAEVDCFRDYVQGDMWKHTLTHYEGKIVLPIFLQGDGYDPDNINGSHAGDHSIFALYYTLPGIPKAFQASLKNMFIALLFLLSDMVNGTKAVFRPVLQELKYLSEHGITIQTENGEQQVYFALALVLGDNLGVHEMLGFMRGFTANYFCRFCKEHRTVTHTQLNENENSLRTVENYEHDVAIQSPPDTGIQEECVFNDVPGYHAITHPSCDIMHDLFEGVCNYGIAHILYYFVFVRQYFSTENLRNIISTFDYGPGEQNNKPPAAKFTDERVRSRNINLSSSEMLCLFRYFGLMVGHLIPANDEVWLYFLKLQEIVYMCMSPVFYHGWDLYLKVLIQEHHEMYLRLFNDTLKPKHHMMIHYPRLIRLHGPPVHLWSMQCERKHRQSKQTARVSLSRVNLPFTLMLKHALQLCFRFLSAIGFQNTVNVCGDIVKFCHLVCYDHIKNFFHEGPDTMCTVTDKCVIFGTKYWSDCVVWYGIEDDKPLFGSAVFFLAFDDNETYLILQKLETVYKNEHVNSYVVNPTKEWHIVKQSALPCFYPLHKRVGAGDGQSYVTLRYAI